jgi:acetoin utilization protein AcuC
MSDHAARLVHCPTYASYDFGSQHPLTPRRLEVALDLLRTAGLLNDADLICPPSATDKELALFHTAQYVEALHRLSAWAPLTEAPLEAEARRYGLGHGDNEVFPRAHSAAAAIAGGSLWAARALFDHRQATTESSESATQSVTVTTGDHSQSPTAATGPAAPPMLHAFHPMGGLHHARAARASGFCLVNDPAIAIAAVVREYGARVLYVDLDVHHGDGVEQAFESDRRVLTVSFHESGDHLFPGTGGVLDRGRGKGLTYAVNVPFAPGTDDDSWIAALDAVLPPLAARFRPDLIVSQHGCDTHVLDPLADLQLTLRSVEHAARLLHSLAHEWCAGRWLATGGGGYDVYRVVPRSWALIWAEMAHRPLPAKLPEQWRARWSPQAPHPFPTTFQDGPEIAAAVAPAAAAQAALRNRHTVDQVRRLATPFR